MMNSVLFVILLVLAILCGIFLIFYIAPALVMYAKIFLRRTDIVQDRSYYAPFRSQIDKALQHLESIPTTEVSITAHDGVILRADFHDGGHDRTAIFMHGYHAGPLLNCAYQASLLAYAGYNVLLVHQRAHGKSGGSSCTLGFLEQEDLLRWIDYAAARPNTRHIVLYGVSMGAATIGFASDRISADAVRAMVLDCGFTSIRDQLATDGRKMHLPVNPLLLTVERMFRIRFHGKLRTPVAASLQNTCIPALFIHGTADDCVPPSHSEANFAACSSEKEALFIPNADHTCAMLAGGEYAMKTLLAFLDKYINKNEKETAS